MSTQNEAINERIRKAREELNQLQTQRDNLQRELVTVQNAHEEARETLVRAGGKREIDAATVAHSRMGALTDALAALDGQLAEKGNELEAARIKERESARLSRLRQLEDERAAAHADLLAKRKRASEALDQHVREIEVVRRRWHELTAEARGLGAQVTDRVSSDELPYGYAVDVALGSFDQVRARDDAKRRSREASERERQRELRTRAA